MKSTINFIICGIMFINTFSYAQVKINHSTNNTNTMETQYQDTPKVTFIDKFFVPKNAKSVLDERMKINRDFIKTLDGFIEDNAYQRTDENGDFIIITVAVWESEEAIKKAKEAVQAKYQKEGFDMQGMLKRLGITIDRGIYEKTVISQL